MNVFARAETAKGFLPRSSENMSHSHFMTMDFGELRVNYLQKCYPSDKIRLDCTNYIRTIPLTTPLNADIQAYQRFYFVPFRILYSHFQDFIFGGEDGSYAPTEPYLVNLPRSSDDYDDLTKWDLKNVLNSVGDDFGFPIETKLRFNSNALQSTHINAYPWAAYQFIYKDFYRNENIQVRGDYNSNQNYDYLNTNPTSKYDDYEKDYGLWHDVAKVGLLDDGPNYCLKNRDDAKNSQWHVSLDKRRYANWSLDYFTSLNPWQQRGDSSAINVARNTEFTASSILTILNQDSYPVTVTLDSSPNSATWVKGNSTAPIGLRLGYGNVYSAGSITQTLSTDNVKGVKVAGPTSPVNPVAQILTGSDFVSLDGTITLPDAKISISDLRLAEQLQIMRELSARGGERFNEGLTAFFHTCPTNLELDRPQYLGGFVQSINVSDIWQTSASTENGTPLGTLAGKGSSLGRNGFGSYLCKEHGLIIGLVHIMPKSMYSNGLSREWNTNSRYDWWFPQFSGLSEQAVYGKELHCVDADHANAEYNAEVLGYQGRGNELRARTSFVTGDFRDFNNAGGSGLYYSAWSLARHFTDSNPPRISDAFLSGRNIDTNGAFSVESGMNKFQLQSYFKVRMVRPVTKRARPIV